MPGYNRNATQPWQIQWLKEESIQQPFCGYDLIAAVVLKLQALGLGQYSLCQVLYASKHPGVTLATAFCSHEQSERMQWTGAAMRNFARRCWCQPVFWLDYSTLKQHWRDPKWREGSDGKEFPGDFTYLRMQNCIKAINNTVMVAADLGKPPSAMDRIFCIFEVLATLSVRDDGRNPGFHVATYRQGLLKWCCCPSHATNINIEEAKSRDASAKETILNMAARIGVHNVNMQCARAIKVGLRVSIATTVIKMVVQVLLVAGALFVVIEDYHS